MEHNHILHNHFHYHYQNHYLFLYLYYQFDEHGRDKKYRLSYFQTTTKTYFQTLSDPDIIYNVELYLNGVRYKNRPSKLFQLFPMKGYVGYYFNGSEMLHGKAAVPVGIMNKYYLHEGDVVKVKLHSIYEDYMYFLLAQKLAVGVNPVMGAYPAVYSNIFSDCNAIGWIATTSVVEGEGIYHEF